MALRTIAAVISTILAAATSADPVYPPFGLDLTARDTSIKPGDDFFQFANGAYLAHLVLPPDEVNAGKRFDMTKRTDAQLHDLLEAAAKDVTNQPADVRGKVGAFYTAFMDETAIEASGIKPLTPELDAIRNANDRSALAGLMGQQGLYPSIFHFAINLDLKNPSAYATSLYQSGLGLPDREYYLKPDFAAVRPAYRGYVANLLRLIGWKDPDESADAILAFETRIAEVSWTAVQKRDLSATYNPMSPAELAAFAPGFDWKRFLDAAQLGGKTV
jgi:putative endopeptidase